MSDYVELSIDGRETPIGLPVCTITRDDDISNGDPLVCGVSVAKIYAIATHGVSIDSICNHYPELDRNQVSGAIQYAMARQDEMESILARNV